MDRKAEVEVQFNWIFVLIIGALILGFFGMIVYQQKKASETKTTHEILSRLDTVFTASSTSKDKIERKETADVEFRFTYKPGYLVGDQAQGLNGRFIFAPSYFRGDSFSIWVKGWNLDFDVVNFAYVTNPTVRYYLIADESDSFAQYINSSIERKSDAESEENLIRMDLISEDELSGIADKGYKRVRLVYFKPGETAPFNLPLPSSLAKRPNSEVSALVIVPAEGDDEDAGESGSLHFYKLSQGQFTSDDADDGTSEFAYVGEELLYGAIFVDKAYAYQYLLREALNKLEIIAKIYSQRSSKLNEGLALSGDSRGCIYNFENFDKIAGYAKESEIEEIANMLPELKAHHEDLIYKSCPSIY